MAKRKRNRAPIGLGTGLNAAIRRYCEEYPHLRGAPPTA